MTAEILSMPRRSPPVRLVFSNTQFDNAQLDRHSLCQLANASDALIAAHGEISEANRVLLRGRILPDHSTLMTGETLESVLRAAMQLALFSGASNRDRAVMQAIRDWLQTNGSASHV